jgi:hypothetical protein
MVESGFPPQLHTLIVVRTLHDGSAAYEIARQLYPKCIQYSNGTEIIAESDKAG